MSSFETTNDRWKRVFRFTTGPLLSGERAGSVEAETSNLGFVGGRRPSFEVGSSGKDVEEVSEPDVGTAEMIEGGSWTDRLSEGLFISGARRSGLKEDQGKGYTQAAGICFEACRIAYR